MLLKRILAVGVCVLTVACTSKPKEPEVEAVAKVNDEAISKPEFESQVERNMARYRGQSHQLPPGIEQRIKESVLRRMIDDVVIEQKAKGLAIAVTPEEIDSKFQEHKSRFRTDKAFEDYLKRSNNTEANMKDDLERNLLRDRVVEKLSGPIEVTEKEVLDYYEENKQRFAEKEQVKASRILVRVAHNATDQERAKAKKEAAELHKKVSKKGADFAAIAREASKGPEAARGGELGWFSRGRMPAEFDDAAFALKPEQISPVVETKLGYEIVKVWETKPERQRTIEEVKQNIENSLAARRRNEKRREVLRDLKAQAKVEKLIAFERPAAGGAEMPRVATPGAGAGKPNLPMPPRNPNMPTERPQDPGGEQGESAEQ